VSNNFSIFRIKSIFLLLFILAAAACTFAVLNPATSEDSLPKLKVLTANIGHCSLNPAPDIEDIVRVLDLKPAPDIIFLQDISGLSQVKELASRLGFKYWAIEPLEQDHPKDLAILSRLKLGNITYYPFRSSQSNKGILCAKARLKQTNFLLCSVHLDRVPHAPRRKGDKYVFPWSALINELGKEMFASSVRSQAVDELLKWLKNKENPSHIILGGDFNTVFTSLAIRKISRELDDALWPSFDYFKGSYRHFNFPLKPRIDYIFHSENIKCLSAEIINKTAGDHYPIWAVLQPESK
jgi:endonuclease/exonuclease/phosphatase family metal-dependent hydrolase